MCRVKLVCVCVHVCVCAYVHVCVWSLVLVCGDIVCAVYAKLFLPLEACVCVLVCVCVLRMFVSCTFHLALRLFFSDRDPI